MKKIKVNLHKTRSEIGLIPVLGNFQTVNRPTKLFAAEQRKNGFVRSVFFIVRPKDANKLRELSYEIKSIILKPGNYPRLLNYGNYTTFDQSYI